MTLFGDINKGKQVLCPNVVHFRYIIILTALIYL